MGTTTPLLSRTVTGSEEVEVADVRERLESLLGSLPAGGCVGAAQAEFVRLGR